MRDITEEMSNDGHHVNYSNRDGCSISTADHDEALITQDGELWIIQYFAESGVEGDRPGENQVEMGCEDYYSLDDLREGILGN